MTQYAENIRYINTQRYKSPEFRKPGDCHFNTHHACYQACLEPSGKFFPASPEMVEMTDAQFELLIQRLRQVRELARRL